jgi:hypothetical protein
VVPLQRFWFGMQSPVQAPFMHKFGQAGMLCQRPFVSHSWGTKAEQRLVVGRHSPAHAAPMQTNWHVTPGSQVPIALHVS